MIQNSRLFAPILEYGFRLAYTTLHLILSILLKNVSRKKPWVIFGSEFGEESSHIKGVLPKFIESCDADVFFYDKKLRRLRRLGAQEQIYGRFASLRMRLEASVYVVTHNIRDIFVMKPPHTTLINLWHGIPIKPIGFDSQIERAMLARVKRRTGYYPYEQWDHLICYSEHHKALMVSATRGMCKNYSILGNPMVAAPRVKANKKKYVVYLPTFRNKPVNDFLLLKNYAELSLEITSGKAADCTQILKKHPSSPSEGLPSGLSKIISNETVSSLLNKASILVTDYSSVIFEAIALKIPVILYRPDAREYLETYGELYDLPYNPNVKETTACREAAGLINQLLMKDQAFEISELTTVETFRADKFVDLVKDCLLQR
ncbi:MAG: hypothetical protein DCO98_02755 [Altererythrobacter sp. XM-24bin4]|nr:MAG: hypothetical protein DCO98_02755 [Altererythrobacter sp. XM-24bin4]